MTTTGNTEIVRGSRVNIVAELYPWSEQEGFVVETDSDRSDEDNPIAVFFGPDVQISNFCTVDFHKIRHWDQKYKTQLQSGDWTFMFEKEVWQNCPRIHHFAPDELVVIED